MASASPRSRSSRSSPFDLVSSGGDSDDSLICRDFPGGGSRTTGFVRTLDCESLGDYVFVERRAILSANTTAAAAAARMAQQTSGSPTSGGLLAPNTDLYGEGRQTQRTQPSSTEFQPVCPSYSHQREVAGYTMTSMPTEDDFFMPDWTEPVADQFPPDAPAPYDMSLMDTSSFETVVPDLSYFQHFHQPQQSQQLQQAHRHVHAAMPSQGLQVQQQMRTSNMQSYNPVHDIDRLRWNTDSLPTSLPTFQPSPVLNRNIEQTSSPKRTSPSVSPTSSDALSLPDVRQDSNKQSAARFHKVHKVQKARVERKKSGAPDPNLRASSSRSDRNSPFFNLTPETIEASSAASSKPFDVFNESRAVQPGRKGPLAHSSKQKALQVRKTGACAWCQSHKVGCGTERPCRRCERVALSVPKLMCWRYQDFMVVLFPSFIREKFKEEQMESFMNYHVGPLQGFNSPRHHEFEVDLASGPLFKSRLKVRARLFAPKTMEVQKHLHMIGGQKGVQFLERWTAPLLLDLKTGPQRDALKRKAKEYIRDLMLEPVLVKQLTEDLTRSDLPKRVLSIVCNFASRSKNPVVNKALSIYTAHHVMTHHLCLTPQSIASLSQKIRVLGDQSHVTSLVLNRQIKAAIDEQLVCDMEKLFTSFSKEFKEKSAPAWGPCVAAFLVVCLFMEMIEGAANDFASVGDGHMKDTAFKLRAEIEDLPFRQFVYLFHHVYQTHSRSSNAKPYNPLLDESLLSEDADESTADMASELRQLLQDPNLLGLGTLVTDASSSKEGEHSRTTDTSFAYTGRLVARFLLTFQDERAIFGT